MNSDSYIPYFGLTILHQNFATCMQGYDSTLFNRLSGSGSEMTMNVQNVLGVGTSDQMVPWQPRTDLTATESARVCSVICAYRLWDVVAMLGGADSAPSVDRRFYEIPNTSFRVSIYLC
jgi:hypothetical protein